MTPILGRIRGRWSLYIEDIHPDTNDIILPPLKDNMTKSKFILILLGVLLGVLAVFYVGRHDLSNSPVVTVKIMRNDWISSRRVSSNSPVTAQQNGKALIGGAFSLIDHHGENVTEADFRGRYMLVYFGYSYCPDVCPTELQIMAEAFDLLPKAVQDEITPVFITIDPDRDTVDVMARYVTAFHAKLVGLTGSVEQIEAAKKTWRIYGAKEKLPEGSDPASYLMSHSSYVYLMDRKGEYVTHFSSTTNAETMADRIGDIINGS